MSAEELALGEGQAREELTETIMIVAA